MRRKEANTQNLRLTREDLEGSWNRGIPRTNSLLKGSPDFDL
jgi:hypothetical protein